MFWSSIFATAMFPVVAVALLLAYDRRKRRLGEKRDGEASSQGDSRTAA